MALPPGRCGLNCSLAEIMPCFEHWRRRNHFGVRDLSRALRHSFTGDSIMKNLTAAMLVAAATAFAGGPVSAATVACSDLDMSQLTAMVGRMADGSHKWQMYDYLAAINTATARNGARGCDVALMNMTRGSKIAKLGT
jgi:hypothetical protein